VGRKKREKEHKEAQKHISSEGERKIIQKTNERKEKIEKGTQRN